MSPTKCDICKEKKELQDYYRDQFYWEVCNSCLEGIKSLNLMLINDKWVKYSNLTDVEKQEALKQNQVYLMQQIDNLNYLNQKRLEEESSSKKILELFKINGYDLSSLKDKELFNQLIERIISVPPLNSFDFADIKKIIESNHNVKISEKISEIKNKDVVALIEIPNGKNLDFINKLQEDIEKENNPKTIEYHFSINEFLKKDDLVINFLIFI